MRKRPPSKSSTPSSDHAARRQKRRTRSPAVLTDLQKRFARFRADHQRGTRVPAALRAATLAALDQGVSATELYQTCGVSWGQLEAWKGGRKPSRAKVEADEPPVDVRVFSVVDPEPVAPPAGEALELRLGPWSVQVRLTGSVQGG